MEKEEKEEDMLQFSESLPWVASTPHSRIARLTEAPEDLPLPPQPSLPAPPAVENPSLTDEELTLVKNLQEIQKLGVELSETQCSKLMELEQKQKATAPPKQLSHGHIHKHNRLKGQVATALAKIEKLDAEWKKLLDGVVVKIQHHGSMYKECRKSLVAVYKEKVKELQSVQQEMHAASESLVGSAADAMTGVEDLEDADLAQQFHRMQSFVQDVDLEVQAISDEEEEMLPATKEDPKGGARKTFRGATSPSKVANLHLKPKADGKEVK